MKALKVYPAKRIVTMDPGRPYATAIAVDGDRIVSVSSIERMRPWLEQIPHEIDGRFADKVLTPGFIDPHTHLRMSGIFMGLVYVGPIPSFGSGKKQEGCATRAEVIGRLRALVQASDDPTRPIVAWGYDPALHGGHLDRDILDEISTTTPIWVMCYAPHIVYTNTPMLELTDVTEDSYDHGIGRFEDGRLNGWFVETAALARVLAPLQSMIFRPGFGEDALRLHAKAAVANGITSVADLGWGLSGSFDDEWTDHKTVAADPSFPLRITLIPFEPWLTKFYGDDKFDYLDRAKAESSNRLNVHGVKWVNDGSYPAMTLKLNPPGFVGQDTGLTGEVPWEDLTDAMFPYWDRGIQIHSHANGDATIDMTLDTLSELQERKPRFDHRFTIEHYSISTPAQAKRLAALGGGASVNAYFVHYRGLLHSDIGYGPDRAEATARLGSLEQAGAHFCIHSDYNMVVVPMAPLTGAWIATNRFAEDNQTVMAPGERISLDRALRAITIDAAFTLRRDHEIGSLEAGKLADMAILEEDPYEVGVGGLRDITVAGTICGGVVHLADD